VLSVGNSLFTRIRYSRGVDTNAAPFEMQGLRYVMTVKEMW